MIPTSFDMLTCIILTFLNTSYYLWLSLSLYCHPGVVLKSHWSCWRRCHWSSCKSAFCWIGRGWSLLSSTCCLLFNKCKLNKMKLFIVAWIVFTVVELTFFGLLRDLNFQVWFDDWQFERLRGNQVFQIRVLVRFWLNWFQLSFWIITFVAECILNREKRHSFWWNFYRFSWQYVLFRRNWIEQQTLSDCSRGLHFRHEKRFNKRSDLTGRH